MRILSIIMFTIITVTVAMAQGPPVDIPGGGGPPDTPGGPPGIPIDGGIMAFLAAAGLAGAGIISFYKKKKAE